MDGKFLGIPNFPVLFPDGLGTGLMSVSAHFCNSVKNFVILALAEVGPFFTSVPSILLNQAIGWQMAKIFTSTSTRAVAHPGNSFPPFEGEGRDGGVPPTSILPLKGGGGANYGSSAQTARKDA